MKKIMIFLIGIGLTLVILLLLNINDIMNAYSISDIPYAYCNKMEAFLVSKVQNQKGDIDTCKKIKSEECRSFCIGFAAAWAKSLDLCRDIKKESFPDYYAECLKKVAIEVEDAKICEKIERGKIKGKMTGDQGFDFREECLSVFWKERGINTEKVEILELEVFPSIKWEDNDREYEIIKVYLTPDIADMGHFRDNFKGKEFLILEAIVKDKRMYGERSAVKTSDYLRLEKDGQKSVPIASGGDEYLSPQEDGKIFSIFTVEKGSKKFLLLAGFLSSPERVDLNLNSDKVTKKTGVFLLKSGFSTEYRSTE